MRSIIEALELSVAKRYSRMGKENIENTIPLVRDQMEKLFKGSDRNGRIVIPYKHVDNVSIPDELVIKASQRLVDALRDQFGGFEFGLVDDIQSMLNGGVQVNGEDEIAKLFMRKQRVVGSKDVNTALTQLGDLRNPKKVGEEYSIVISRHPYDVAGMSTNREAWRSCKELNRGVNAHYVEREVGRLGIAYLTKKKLEGHPVRIGKESRITKDPVGQPMLRLNIVPWIDYDHEVCYYSPFVPGERSSGIMRSLVYGGASYSLIQSFINTVLEFVEKQQGVAPKGEWIIPKDLYHDVEGRGGSGESIDTRPEYQLNSADVSDEEIEERISSIIRNLDLDNGDKAEIVNSPENSPRLMHSLIDAFMEYFHDTIYTYDSERITDVGDLLDRIENNFWDSDYIETADRLARKLNEEYHTSVDAGINKITCMILALSGYGTTTDQVENAYERHSFKTETLEEAVYYLGLLKDSADYDITRITDSIEGYRNTYAEKGYTTPNDFFTYVLELINDYNEHEQGWSWDITDEQKKDIKSAIESTIEESYLIKQAGYYLK